MRKKYIANIKKIQKHNKQYNKKMETYIVKFVIIFISAIYITFRKRE